jgi:RNA-binding protein
MKGSHEAALRFPSMLTPRQRQFLKGLAHPLSVVVRVGKTGVTPSVVEETKKSLAAHELIKVRIEVEEGAARRSPALALARGADAELVGTIGKTAILYRTREQKPTIKLPK